MNSLALTIFTLFFIGSLDARRFPLSFDYDFVVTLKSSGFEEVKGSITSLSFTSGLILRNTQSFEDQESGARLPSHVSFAPNGQLRGSVRLVKDAIDKIRSIELLWEADAGNDATILLDTVTFSSNFSPYSYDFCYNKPIHSGKAVSLSAC